LRFPPESLYEQGILSQRRQHHLQRYSTFQVDIFRQIDIRHAASRYVVADAILRYELACG
jgi:hypothetical protein